MVCVEWTGVKDKDIYLINYLLKMHLHSTAFHIFVFIRTVNQNRKLFRSYLLSSVSKHKEHWIYDIGLSASIRTNDARKPLGKKKKTEISITENITNTKATVFPISVMCIYLFLKDMKRVKHTTRLVAQKSKRLKRIFHFIWEINK